ncbi:LysM peptidoglycan-binding domain-containing protein [Desulfobacter latus]|uniref:LysM peptidoglycan-binding domain-containing protein n=1 Tax=Desulfobacter latus TaxID=2292 RepID=A0A850T5Z7_9BACT|nr:LysM domain-containing protein [Desulfobacter latus]NWH04375.1 LysM peptidoglycan-binding domain-containing protein [Desulfobacter latus]
MGLTSCPICGFSNIPEDRENCPQCDADLVCFRLLEEGFPVPSVPGTDMPETEDAVEQAPPASSQNNTGAWGRGIGICAAVMVVLAILLISWAATHRLAGLAGSVAALDARLGQVDRTHEVSRDIQSTAIRIGNQVNILERRIERMDSRVEKVVETLISGQKKTPEDIDQNQKKEMAGEIPAAPEPCMKKYQAKDTDTLWGIARELWGSGIYYPVLMACNPDLNIFTINRRDRLMYPCDKTRVRELYRQMTAVKQNRWYWKYTVRPGDTPQSVADRYCSDKNNCFVSGFPFKTGETIGIFLE